jgi:NAD(P)-dependent dehydrogenase (short-subunit alcohol dehydrogenase family)
MTDTKKVAIVTGASRGIGAAVARALAKEGYAVAVAARATREQPRSTPGTLDDVVDRIRDDGGEALSVPTDLYDRAQVAAMVERTVAAYGRLDVLVNNAAASFRGDWDQPLRHHDFTMTITFDAPYVACRQAVPHFRAVGEGRILNVSSGSAFRSPPGTEASLSYGAAKIALEHLSVDLARQLASDRIAVNCFRVDTGVATQGALDVMPGDISHWPSPETAAEGVIWMLSQPVSYSGRLEGMRYLALREGIMPSVAALTDPLPPNSFPDPDGTLPHELSSDGAPAYVVRK